MTKQPFLPLFFGDFLASTSDWSGEEQALYLLLLGHQWSLGSIPADTGKLCRMARWDRKLFDRCWETVSEKFEERDGRLLNSRLETHRARAEEIASKRATAGSKGAAKRYGKEVAIAKDLPQQTDSNCQANATFLLCHPNQSIPEQEPRAADAACENAVQDPRKQLFDLGKTILGAKSGSLISAAISRVGEEDVGRILGQMALKPTADPKAYFSAATTPKERRFVC